MPVTRTPVGRYCVGQTLFAVYFGYSAKERAGLLYCKPLVWNNDMSDSIHFKHLTVTEHHRVFNEWADQKGEPDCDGYILKDDTDQLWANQYPYASYGQMSDEGNRRFRMHFKEAGKLKEKLESEPNGVYEYHLLSDVLQSMEKGIKDLGSVVLTAPNAKEAREKLELLKVLYARTIKEFEETFPDYHVDMAWEKVWAASSLQWPRAKLYQRLSLDKARDLNMMELLQTFASERRLEVELATGRDRLVIEDAKGEYYIDGETRMVPTINVFYLEHTGEIQDGKPCFYVCATEYFRRAEIEQAVDCFYQRLRGDMPSRGVRMGKSLEMIYRLDIEANKPVAEAPQPRN